MVAFGEPVLDQDPSIDLIVALTRKDEPGLWIPTLTSGIQHAVIRRDLGSDALQNLSCVPHLQSPSSDPRGCG